MVDEWIFKTFSNSSGKIHTVFFGKRQSGDDLVIDGFIHKV